MKVLAMQNIIKVMLDGRRLQVSAYTLFFLKKYIRKNKQKNNIIKQNHRIKHVAQLVELLWHMLEHRQCMQNNQIFTFSNESFWNNMSAIWKTHTTQNKPHYTEALVTHKVTSKTVQVALQLVKPLLSQNPILLY